MVMEGGVQEASPTVSAESSGLASFRSCLWWLCMDHSTFCRSLLSWFLFFILGIAVPLCSPFFLPSSATFTDSVFQICLTSASFLAFLLLFVLTRPDRLLDLLSINQLRHKRDGVRDRYTAHIRRFIPFLALFVVPSAASDAAYEIWGFWSASRRTNLDTIVGMLEVASWVYRTGTFYMVCVLFRLICKLQSLSLTDFAEVLRESEDVAMVQREHERVQRQLRIISQKFQVFIVCGFILVTISQLSMVFLNTPHRSQITTFNRVKLALCSIALVTGLLICLRSAVKITHSAQCLVTYAATMRFSETELQMPFNIRRNPVVTENIRVEEIDNAMEILNLSMLARFRFGSGLHL